MRRCVRSVSLLLFILCLEAAFPVFGPSDDGPMPSYKVRWQKSCEAFRAKMEEAAGGAGDLEQSIKALLDRVPEDERIRSAREQLGEARSDVRHYLEAVQRYREGATEVCDRLMEPVSKSEAIGRAKHYEGQLSKLESEFQSNHHYFNDAVRKHNEAIRILNEIGQQSPKEKVVDLNDFFERKSPY